MEGVTVCGHHPERRVNLIGIKAHSPVKCEIPKNTRPRHLKFFRTLYIFVTNCF